MHARANRTGALRRVVMGGVAAVVAVASLVGAPSPASAHHLCQRNYQFVPKWMDTLDIEDWFESADEIELRYLDVKWGASAVQHRQTYPPASGVFTRFPGERFPVTLHEWDGSTPRQLGAHSVTATAQTAANSGNDFVRDGDYAYRLYYEVKDLGVTGCVALSGFSLNPTSVVGGNKVRGTVTLSGPTPPEAVIVYLSDNSDATSFPSYVTIPGGQSSASFDISTKPVAADTPVRILASADGVAKEATLTVKAPTLSSVTVNPACVVGGNGASLTVKLTGAAAVGGVPGTITVNSPAVSAPSSFTVSSTASSEQIWLGTSAVNADTNAIISVTVKGLTKTVPFCVKAPSPANFTLDPSSVLGGGVANASLGLTGPAPAGGVTISLSYSNGAAYGPTSVFVPGREWSAGFQVRTTPVSADTPVTLSATANGVTKTAGLTVRVPRPGSVSVDPTVVEEYGESTGTVTLEAPAPAGGLTVSLGSSDPFAAQPPASVFVPGGAWSAPFGITTSDVDADTNVTITAKVANVSKSAMLTVRNAWEPPPDECDPRLRYCE